MADGITADGAELREFWNGISRREYKERRYQDG